LFRGFGNRQHPVFGIAVLGFTSSRAMRPEAATFRECLGKTPSGKPLSREDERSALSYIVSVESGVVLEVALLCRYL
jgi:hypothetical protein